MNQTLKDSGSFFTNISTAVGLVSGVIGIIQFLQQNGPTIWENIGRALYYAGFIAFSGAVIGGLLMGLILWVLSKIGFAATPQGSNDISDRAIGFAFALVAVLVGAWAGVPMAEHNSKVLKMNALERLTQGNPQAIPELLMMGIGLVAILGPIVVFFMERNAPKGDANSNRG